MPPTTALRRALTLVVGALFAVVFVCSAASTTHGVTTRGESSVSAHTATSKAVTRSLEHAVHVVKNKAPSPLQLASTGPYEADKSPLIEVDSVESLIASQDSPTDIVASDRAPPTL